MTNLLIIQEDNVSVDTIEKIKCLDHSSDLGIFFQFSGVYAIDKILSVDKINAKLYACKNSVERRSIPTPNNIKIVSLGTLHELCDSCDKIEVFGKLK